MQEHNLQKRNANLLGSGSYGAVYKTKCDQLPCAAKIVHSLILDPQDPEARKIMERFEQECAFLERYLTPKHCAVHVPWHD